MKKIVMLSFILIASLPLFAFEGIIKQNYVNTETNESSSLIWYIDGEKIRLDILVGEERITAIPDFKNKSLNIYGYVQSNDGNYYYMNSPVATIESKVPNMKLLEHNEATYENEDAIELKLISSKGMMMVQYLPSIDFDAQTLMHYFADNFEIKAIALANGSGFPVSGMMITDKDALHTLSTQSITATTVENDMFVVPSNYKLFEGIK